MKKKLNCILLIDDDESNNFINNMLLEEAGCTHHIQIEDSGKKALKYLIDTAELDDKMRDLQYPELISLDINMPIMFSSSFNPDDKLHADNIPMVAGFENKPLTSI
ncbi:MAG: response regulator [Ferruginibacter sp.]